ncbi:MAG: ParB/RepB/Spo0J family partition protein [Anaerolineae bacterium]|nr:ParB/RepB/Spo0J family partition protein [Anaerolineae bacterium]MCB0252341.1 ParB/RepB/Spo0J family partition protein [Anaerolineae bacterium]
MTTRRGLGKGLGALIPPGDGETSRPPAGVAEVPVGDIAPNPRQPRDAMELPALEELAESIRTHGLIQPLVLTIAPAGSATRYYLVAGERRWRASRMAGLASVPAIVKDVSPQGMLELALVENVQRADLNPLEEAAAYYSLVEEFGLTQEVVAARVGKSRVAVANSLRLLRLPDAAKEAVVVGQIREGHARALLGLADDALIEKALAIVIDNEMTVRQTEELVRRMQQAASEPAVDDSTGDEEDSPETRELESRLRDALGTKVNLFRSRRGGRIVIHFYSEEELGSIYDMLVGPSDL